MSLNSANVSKENQEDYRWCKVKATPEKGNSRLSFVTGRLKLTAKLIDFLRSSLFWNIPESWCKKENLGIVTDCLVFVYIT